MSFDANSVNPMEQRDSFEVLPAGDYMAIVAATHKKQTKAGNGHYLNIEFQLIGEGQYKGRKIWTNLNLDNPNNQAVSIARSELSSICRATGVMNLDSEWDLSPMQAMPLTLTLGVNKNGFRGEPENTIRNYDKAQQPGFTPPPMGDSRPDETENLPF